MYIKIPFVSLFPKKQRNDFGNLKSLINLLRIIFIFLKQKGENNFKSSHIDYERIADSIRTLRAQYGQCEYWTEFSS